MTPSSLTDQLRVGQHVSLDLEDYADLLVAATAACRPGEPTPQPMLDHWRAIRDYDRVVLLRLLRAAFVLLPDRQHSILTLVGELGGSTDELIIVMAAAHNPERKQHDG